MKREFPRGKKVVGKGYNKTAFHKKTPLRSESYEKRSKALRPPLV